MKPRNSIQSFAIQRNTLFREVQEEDFDSYKLKNYHRKTSSKPFTDKTNNLSNSKRKERSSAIRPHLSKIKNQTTKISLQFDRQIQGSSIESIEENESQKADSSFSLQQNSNFQSIFTEPSNKFSENALKQNLYQELNKENQIIEKIQNNCNQSSTQKFDPLQFQQQQNSKTQINLCLQVEKNLDFNDCHSQKDQNFLKSIIPKKIPFEKSSFFKNIQQFQEQKQTKQKPSQKISEQNANFTTSAMSVQNQIKNKKDRILLINFDESDQSSSDTKSPRQIQQNSTQVKNVKTETDKTCNQLSLMQNQSKGIILNDFGQSESSENCQTFQKSSPVILKDMQNQSQQMQQSQEQINLTQTISITQMIKILSKQFFFQPIPQNYTLQTLVKRYQNSSQNKFAYEIFDQATFQTILKVKAVSEGFEILGPSKPFSSFQDQNFNPMCKVAGYTSCALLKSNFFGTEFNCFKFNCLNQKVNSPKLCNLITIHYEANFFGFKGPRKMSVCIPDSNLAGEKGLQAIYEDQMKQTNGGKSRVSYFVNRTPKWNSQISSFVLNFNGRAAVSSAKNFIICRPKNNTKINFSPNENLVLFGKMQKNMFNLDIKHPFSLVQGLALALSSFNNKFF